MNRKRPFLLFFLVFSMACASGGAGDPLRFRDDDRKDPRESVNRNDGGISNQDGAAQASSEFDAEFAAEPDASRPCTPEVCDNTADDDCDGTTDLADSDCTPSCIPPPEPVLTSCDISWDRRPVLEFTPLASGVVYDITRDGVGHPIATLTEPGTNYFRPTDPVSQGAPPPLGEALTFRVRAYSADDPTCFSESAPVTIKLIEECATPVAPTTDNLVFSEYIANGDGTCSGPDCEAGEAIEIANLSNCPVSLAGFHFAYCNGDCAGFRWMDFSADDVVPPRGVYVAIRDPEGSSCEYPFFAQDNPALFGMKTSRLEMQGSSLASGWFNNAGGGQSTLRVASGSYSSISAGTAITALSPYSGAAGECESVGFNAIDACGELVSTTRVSEVLSPNQLGRFWHPCDAVTTPFPQNCE